MKNNKAAKQITYRESIMKPGAARIQLEGRCNPFLGGSADEACIFVNEAAARAEIAILNSNSNRNAIDSWEIQTLRADGMWQGCVASGVFEHPEVGA